MSTMLTQTMLSKADKDPGFRNRFPGIQVKSEGGCPRCRPAKYDVGTLSRAELGELRLYLGIEGAMLVSRRGTQEQLELIQVGN